MKSLRNQYKVLDEKTLLDLNGGYSGSSGGGCSRSGTVNSSYSYGGAQGGTSDYSSCINNNVLPRFSSYGTYAGGCGYPFI